ncbi:MAG: diguanylate cyclase, partial [Ketobacteraceae bacterium]|nr:diguanylate cyclase [Ketobacteraceae bacterium]
MPGSMGSQRPGRSERRKIKLILSALVLLGIVAIVFTILVIQIQSATTSYLSGLAIWSRGQVESVRQTAIYARTGHPEALAEARRWLAIPYGDMMARQHMAGDDYDFEAAREGLLQGANHPDDIPRMIWLFRAFHSAPFFRDAITAWRDSDPWLLRLGTTINKLENQWQDDTPDERKLTELQKELNVINQQLTNKAAEFRDKMSFASRALVTTLSITTIIFFVLLSSIASLLIRKLFEAVRRSESKFRKTFEHAAMGIAQIDNNGLITEANDALCDILKYRRARIVATPLQELIHPQDRKWAAREQSLLSRGDRDSLSLKQRFCCGDGSLVWAKATMSRFEGRRHDDIRYICILEDVSEQHRLSEELNYQARHDALTGLINRRAFATYLEEALVRARSEHFVHCLCFIDLDRFKIVNDTSGHYAGDQVLQQVTQRFARHLRKSDLLARLGGDEFGLILDCCEPETALKLADSLLESLNEAPFVWEAKTYSIGCSIGIVPITANSTDGASLLQAADSACQMAKEQGRNRIVLTHQGDEELAARRNQLEWLGRIRDALKQEKLFLEAQRIVPVNRPSSLRVEVLVRMLGDDN